MLITLILIIIIKYAKQTMYNNIFSSLNDRFAASPRTATAEFAGFLELPDFMDFAKLMNFA